MRVITDKSEAMVLDWRELVVIGVVLLLQLEEFKLFRVMFRSEGQLDDDRRKISWWIGLMQKVAIK